MTINLHATHFTAGVLCAPNRLRILNGNWLLLFTPADVVNTKRFTDWGVASIKFFIAT